jgi:GntR family transcriptional regulator, transcriptional repressor for pyruvate dehydrogenase complex
VIFSVRASGGPLIWRGFLHTPKILFLDERGARLPSERELAEQLKVSRPSVREALIALEVEGVVEVRPGAGVFVCAPVRLFPSYASSEGPLEIMRARIAIEGETAAMAAKQIRDADIRELGRILETMDPHLHFQDFYLPADRAFHLYIAEKAGNSVLIRIVAELFDARHSPLSLQFGNVVPPKKWTRKSV